MIALGGVAAWPRAAFAQASSRVYRIGTLGGGFAMTDDDPNGASLIRGLTQLGYDQGRNLVLERRGAEGQIDRLPRLLDELVASKIDLIIGVSDYITEGTKARFPAIAERCHTVYNGVDPIRFCPSPKVAPQNEAD